ncbi:MAG: 2-dehydro-3-deoxyphosphogluconate aldolase, partial [Alphaproteobacteria bacterium]
MSKLTVEQVMELAPVIPVLVVDRVEDALTIARELVAGGLPALEV